MTLRYKTDTRIQAEKWTSYLIPLADSSSSTRFLDLWSSTSLWMKRINFSTNHQLYPCTNYRYLITFILIIIYTARRKNFYLKKTQFFILNQIKPLLVFLDSKFPRFWNKPKHSKNHLPIAWIFQLLIQNLWYLMIPISKSARMLTIPTLCFWASLG